MRGDIIDTKWWRDWQVQRLRELDGKVDVDAIAERLGKSVEQIVSKLHDMRGRSGCKKVVQSVSWSASEDAELYRLRSKGLSFAQISRLMKRTRSSVAGRIARLRKAARWH